MAYLSIGLGVVLMALGFGGYVYTERESRTALIPVILGALLLLLGVLAQRENLRKHSMHLALVLALIGLAGSGWRGIAGIINGAKYPGAPYINLAIALCCAVFLALGIRSFVEARRRRLQPPGP